MNHTLAIGEGNAAYLVDLIKGVSDDEMRRRFKAGHYGKLRQDYAQMWRKQHGRV